MKKTFCISFLLLLISFISACCIYRSNEIMSNVMQVILLTTISLTILTGLLIAFDVDDWIYAKTIGVITLSAHPLYKPSKLKIKSTITLNSKGEQKEKIYVKVLFLFFWWKLHEVRYHDDYDLGGYNTNELRTFKSIDEAKEFLEQYMKPVEKVYNLA